MYEKCKFCKTFWSIPIKYHEIVVRKNKPVVLRKCPNTNQLMSPDDSCKHFELTNYIWCTHGKIQEQVPTMACANRQKTKQCTKCRQGGELLKLIWELNRTAKPIIKPKRKLIRKEKNK